MKRMMMSAASVLALAIAGPALAQSVSTVNQSNTGNSANVDQTASLSGGDSLINQSGANNQANVSQGDDGSGATPINVSEIDQNGNSDLANDSKDTSTNDTHSDTHLSQPDRTSGGSGKMGSVRRTSGSTSI